MNPHLTTIKMIKMTHKKINDLMIASLSFHPLANQIVSILFKNKKADKTQVLMNKLRFTLVYKLIQKFKKYKKAKLDK
jgi:hypothetical protein